MQQIAIRPAVGRDVPAIAAVTREAYEPYVERIGREPAPMGDDYERLVVDGCIWVLVVDEVVGGLIVMRVEAEYVLIDNVAVGSAYRGQGFGRKLLGHAETHAHENGMDELRLYTNELMHENLAIYARFGWEEYERAEQNGFRRVFMRKRIARDPDASGAR